MSESTSKSLDIQKVKVKFIGVLASAAGTRETELDLPVGARVSDLLPILLRTFDKKQFREILVDSSTGDPRTNVIILLNDQDCGVFSGLRTSLEMGTVVTIIPVAHGG